jgi:hypothetical protein
LAEQGIRIVEQGIVRAHQAIARGGSRRLPLRSSPKTELLRPTALCIAPKPEFRCVLAEIRDMRHQIAIAPDLRFADKTVTPDLLPKHWLTLPGT